jgi:hypothetical protein
MLKRRFFTFTGTIENKYQECTGFGPAGCNLTAYYSFTTDAFLSDTANAGLNLTTSEVPPHSADECPIVGGCAAFTPDDEGKTGQFFRIPAYLRLSNEFSICLWYLVRRSAKPWGNRLFDFSNGQLRDNLFLGRLKDTDKLVLGFERSLDSKQSIVLSTEEFSPDKWRHVCVTKNVSGLVSVFINGALRSDKVIDGLSVLNVSINYIGRSVWADGGDKDFHGVIDEFRIYDKCLVLEEVAEIHNWRSTNSDGTTKSGLHFQLLNFFLVAFLVAQFSRILSHRTFRVVLNRPTHNILCSQFCSVRFGRYPVQGQFQADPTLRISRPWETGHSGFPGLRD